MAEPRVSTQPITADDAEAVGRFLHERLNPAVTAEAWARLVDPPWAQTGPNRGFQLVAGEGSGAAIVGVYAAVYSQREVEGVAVDVCNLAAFCVVEEHRAHGLKLVRALLRQPGLVFTDLSPSGNVVAMNERLGFRRLDTATRLVVNVPGLRRRGTRITRDPAALERVLVGRDAQVFADHRHAAGVEPLLVERDGRVAWLLFRRDRRKGLRLFATPIFAGGDAALLAGSWGAIRARLLRRGLPLTLAEHRVLDVPHGIGVELRSPRPKMVRGDGLADDRVDYLYSELALVPW